MMTRSFFALRIDPVVCRLCGVPYGGRTGEASEALNRAREGEQLLEHQVATGIVAHRSWACHALGRACLLLGQLDEARRLGKRSVESSQRQPGFAAYARRLLGDVATDPERFDAESGAAHYLEALELAQLHGMRPLVAHCHLGLGKLYCRTGQPEHARDNLTTAMKMYREMDMGFWLKQEEADMMNSGDVAPGVRPATKFSVSGSGGSP
jgi:tetratricopeptide (TPR) repeat protein